MGSFEDFIERMKKEKPGFREHWDMMRPLRELLNKLVEVRIVQGMTQTELAEKAGLKQSALSRLENGRIPPNITTVLAVVKALGMRVTLEEDNDER
jgi:DNA-binding XRE family transcriptional regulator